MAHLHLNKKGNKSKVYSEFGILPSVVQECYTNPPLPFDQLMVENGDVTTKHEESNSYEKFPVRTTGKRCNLRVTTDVDKKLCTQGWTWIIFLVYFLLFGIFRLWLVSWPVGFVYGYLLEV